MQKELVGYLDKDAGAIARVDLSAARSSMVKVLERRQTVPQQLVGALTFQVDDKADAAGIVLELRSVESPFGRTRRVRHGGSLLYRPRPQMRKSSRVVLSPGCGDCEKIPNLWGGLWLKRKYNSTRNPFG
jgi:hypothetical protein